MLKCPNCGTEIKLTWKRYVREYYNMPCENCGTVSRILVNSKFLVYIIYGFDFFFYIFCFLGILILQKTFSFSEEWGVTMFMLSAVMLAVFSAFSGKFASSRFATLVPLKEEPDNETARSGRTQKPKPADEIQPGSPDNWNV